MNPVFSLHFSLWLSLFPGKKNKAEESSRTRSFTRIREDRKRRDIANLEISSKKMKQTVNHIKFFYLCTYWFSFSFRMENLINANSFLFFTVFDPYLNQTKPMRLQLILKSKLKGKGKESMPAKRSRLEVSTNLLVVLKKIRILSRTSLVSLP